MKFQKELHLMVRSQKFEVRNLKKKKDYPSHSEIADSESS